MQHKCFYTVVLLFLVKGTLWSCFMFHCFSPKHIGCILLTNVLNGLPPSLNIRRDDFWTCLIASCPFPLSATFLGMLLQPTADQSNSVKPCAGLCVTWPARTCEHVCPPRSCAPACPRVCRRFFADFLINKRYKMGPGSIDSVIK